MSLFWFCGSPWIFIQINNFFKLPVPGIEPLTLGLQVQRFPPTPRGTPFIHSIIWLIWKFSLEINAFGSYTSSNWNQKFFEIIQPLQILGFLDYFRTLIFSCWYFDKIDHSVLHWLPAGLSRLWSPYMHHYTSAVLSSKNCLCQCKSTLGWTL